MRATRAGESPLLLLDVVEVLDRQGIPYDRDTSAQSEARYLTVRGLRLRIAAHTGPHIHEDVCCLEVVTPDGNTVPDGERGQLVVTKLTPGSVFVRYNTADIAAFLPGDCPCGRTFRRLKIYGRPESSVQVDGRTVTAVTFVVDSNPNYTNACVTDCSFCAFYRKPGDTEAWTLTVDQVL